MTTLYCPKYGRKSRESVNLLVIMYHEMIYEVQKMKICLMEMERLHPEISSGQSSSQVPLHCKRPKGKTNRETLATKRIDFIPRRIPSILEIFPHNLIIIPAGQT